MRINYLWGNVNVYIKCGEIEKILSGKPIFQRALEEHENNAINLNFFPSDEFFCCSGELGEGFENESFQGFILQPPREQVQLAFPWGEEEHYRNYTDLDIKISKLSLRKKVENSRENYFCGMARGTTSLHLIDRIHLHFDVTQ